MLTNITILLVPYISFYVVSVVLLLLVWYKTKKCFKVWKILSTLTLLVFLIAGYGVITSPLIQPVNDVHNKEQEISYLKKEQNTEAIKPVLNNNSRKSETVDLSKTPLFDKAVNSIDNKQ